ncbi:MAG: endopeptidase La [Proteobacteria bacterium]|nr:endopeptidase La [Pseudomonadota bacterium]
MVIPELLPVLAVRNTVLFPNAAVPLVVGRKKSVEAVRASKLHGDIVLVVSQKDGGVDDPKPTDLFQVGVVCHISKSTEVEKDNFQVIVNGLFRFKVSSYTEEKGFISAQGQQLTEISSTLSSRLETLSEEIKGLAKAVLKLAAVPGSDGLIKILNQIHDPSQIADLASTLLHLPVPQKQELLELMDVEQRLHKLLEHLVREKNRLDIQTEIQSKLAEKMTKDQREHILREQMRAISEELGEDKAPGEDFMKKIEAASLPPEVLKVAREEASRLSQVPRSSPEYQVIRTYLELLLALPWNKSSGLSSEALDLSTASEILDKDHYGLEKVKNRILQFLAVTKLKKDMKGPILCLAGPPGVGKTSMAKSIATALGRSFVRMSLGGVRDEAEIRGHRRTYIGSMPGRLIQSIKRAGVNDPVILLDEIDKIGMDFRGDPSSALLEVLDPEQNHTFTDHYLDVPFDLSRVFFITTANRLDTIPPALRDRLEIIEMSSYTKTEKIQIASDHLVPKVLSEHGMGSHQLLIQPATIDSLIEAYTREAGVRQLTREIANLVRASATEVIKSETVLPISIAPDKLEDILGPRKYFTETTIDQGKPGVVTGLAWTPVGGEILHVEVTKMEGKGNLILTGQLGDVMKESAQIAVSLLRSQVKKALPVHFDKLDFHIHVPAGAIPKDGPSAGVAIFLALSSLVQNKAVDTKLACSGEITLRGSILPVGGIKEKVLAAHRAGIKTVILPERNQADLKDVAREIKEQLTFHFVKDVHELLTLADLKAIALTGVPVPAVGAGAPSAHPPVAH